MPIQTIDRLVAYVTTDDDSRTTVGIVIKLTPIIIHELIQQGVLTSALPEVMDHLDVLPGGAGDPIDTFGGSDF